MSEQRALFAAICAHPEEDTPRLAYADWLDEPAGASPLAALSRFALAGERRGVSPPVLHRSQHLCGSQGAAAGVE